MSWGERSCIYSNKDSRPCNPTQKTCNVNCNHYKSNGKNPDSKSKKENVTNHNSIKSIIDNLIMKGK